VTCGRSVVFYTNKTDHHDITIILLKMVLSTITINPLDHTTVVVIDTDCKGNDHTTVVVIDTDCKGNDHTTVVVIGTDCRGNDHTTVVTSNVYKVFSKILEECIMSHLEEKNILGEAQGAFRRDRRLEDHFFTLHELCSLQKYAKKKTI
jgi:hypothetical protein